MTLVFLVLNVLLLVVALKGLRSGVQLASFGILILQYLVIVTDSQIGLFPRFPDANTYYEYAILWDSISVNLKYSQEKFVILLSYIYDLILNDEILARFLNSTISLVSVVILYRSALNLRCDRRSALLFFWVLILLPSRIVFHLSLLRESAALLGISLIFYSFVNIVKGKNIVTYGAILFGGLFVTFMIRFENIYILAVFVSFITFLYSFLWSYKAGLIVSAVLFAIAGFIQKKMYGLLQEVNSSIRANRYYLVEYGTYEGILDVIIKIPKKVASYTFSPSPFRLENYRYLTTTLSNVYMYVSLLAIITIIVVIKFLRLKGLKYKGFGRYSFVLVVFFGVFLTSYALAEANINSHRSVRHSISYVWALYLSLFMTVNFE